MPNVKMRETSCISPTILLMLTRYMKRLNKKIPIIEMGMVINGLIPRKNHKAKVKKDANMINSPWVRLIMVITPKTKLNPEAARP